MSWNYRVVLEEVKEEPLKDWFYASIYEVYYDKQGKPEGCTTKPILSGTEALTQKDAILELKDSLDLMLSAFDKPLFEIPEDWDNKE
jgi:hypothetical protein